MAKIRIKAAEIVKQRRHQDFEQSGASVGRHIFGGQIAYKSLAEHGLPVASKKDLKLIPAWRDRRVEVRRREHTDGLPRIGLTKIILV